MNAADCAHDWTAHAGAGKGASTCAGLLVYPWDRPLDRKAAQELTTRYKELQLDTRLERLDRAVAENERRIHLLTKQAEADLEAGNHRALANVLDAASRLQRHNAHLFKLIDSTELRLISTAKQAAGQAKR